MSKTDIEPEQLHKWYLEATKKIDPANYNVKAAVKYADLNDDQKFLDKYIANKVADFYTAKFEACLPEKRKWAKSHEYISSEVIRGFNEAINEARDNWYKGGER